MGRACTPSHAAARVATTRATRASVFAFSTTVAAAGKRERERESGTMEHGDARGLPVVSIERALIDAREHVERALACHLIRGRLTFPTRATGPR
jgi:hypothetical protein